MAFGQAFSSADAVRFSQSPSGGGEGNPAWDFQLIVPEAKVNEEIRLRMRLVYKPWKGREDVLSEVRAVRDVLSPSCAVGGLKKKFLGERLREMAMGAISRGGGIWRGM